MMWIESWQFVTAPEDEADEIQGPLDFPCHLVGDNSALLDAYDFEL